ncbi:diacylglycerol/lipid kinase family protein [Microbacterium marinilacus]|uniref:Diacylglycerol kinase family protein n=1 Tax=Microbacterium marinilacus TaxID=415209 RepID=A0ABP7BGB6_9MICO|nr:diacylglycerol kinase family protein [Microbacterium marinilacus]MBY0689552.1 NAD(+)/NADH kinase [Microbacterium marinilacus]
MADDTAPDAPAGKRAALVFNPVKVDGPTLCALVERHSAEAGWEPPLLLATSVEDPGQSTTRDALAEGVSAVLVAGGDGTVRAVSEAVRGSGVPLSIVPSGTGNLLARNLLLPLDSQNAMVAAAFDGETVDVDICVATLRRQDGHTEEHAFVVMAGMGLDAAMIANTRPELKKSVGWVAYVDGAARSLVSAEPFRVVYEIARGGGEEPPTLTSTRLHSARVQSILFANCGELPGRISLIPDASIVDGDLDVALIQPTGPLGWLGVWRKVWWDNSVLRRTRAGRAVLERRGRDTSVRYLRGAAAEAATPIAQPVELDGDEFGEATRVSCRVEKGNLKVAVPKGHRISAM